LFLKTAALPLKKKGASAARDRRYQLLAVPGYWLLVAASCSGAVFYWGFGFGFGFGHDPMNPMIHSGILDIGY
jgi:hypothetical protein